MKAGSGIKTLFAVVLGCALLLLSGTMAWAAANDFKERGTVPLGVTVAGNDIGGMTQARARKVIEETVASPLQKPLEVNADGKSWTFDASRAVVVDIDGMLDEAYRARSAQPFVSRLTLDVAHKPVSLEVEPLYSVDAATLASWVETISANVDRDPVDAAVDLKGNTVVVRAAETGRHTDASATADAIRNAINLQSSSSRRVVEASVSLLEPKVTEDELGKTIVVDLSERRIRLYKGATLEKAYRCAIGTPSYPTPRGKFKIVQKRFLPTWSNPGSDWAKDMPPTIPPGPSNPLGTRALNLNAPGIRIHGTTKIGSIGTAASHGCMRMVRHDIEDLYPRVPVGTTVYIVP